MRSNIRLSAYATIITLLIFTLMLIGCISVYGSHRNFFILLLICGVIVIYSLIYAPLAIELDSDRIRIISFLRKHSLPIDKVVSVELFQPTMGAIRLCASGGFMGHWGLYREGDIGRYMAFYGKSSDCFLIRMKNGDKYVLGCENPAAMVNYINSRVRH